MRHIVLGALVAMVLVMVFGAVLSQRTAAYGQRPAVVQTPNASGELIVVPASSGEKLQALVVIDPRQQAMGVYHVDAATGKIALRSVRNLRWDLQMTYLNNEAPLPQEIRSLLEPR
jgi:hypothetical protein